MRVLGVYMIMLFPLGVFLGLGSREIGANF